MKLLVNAPTGQQELIEIGEGGGYFDLSRVLWDEREDGPLPEITLGGMVRVDGALAFDQLRMDEHTAASGPAVPQSVSMRQAREALIRRGYFAAVNAYIAGMSGIEGDIARNEWEMSQVVERNRPLTLAMGALIPLDGAGMDELFVFAATL